MKTIRFALPAALALMFAVGVMADNLPDMRAIFDGPSGGNTYSTTVITSTPFTISASDWAPCVTGQLAQGQPAVQAFLNAASAAGDTAYCFTGENDTSSDWTNMSFEVDFPALGSTQTTQCDSIPGFTSACGQLNLAAGATSADITVSGTIPTANGTTPGDPSFTLGIFGAGLSQPTGGNVSVPEPATIMLIPTGLLVLGLVWNWRRRQLVA